MSFFKKYSKFFIGLLFFSCSQSLDFEQADEYTTNSMLTSSLLFFTIDANDFAPTSGGTAVTQISETTDFKLFENTFIKDNLVKIDFNFEVINSLNHDFIVEIILFDKDNNPVYSFSDLPITATTLDFKQQESIDIVINPNIKNFTRVDINLRLADPLATISSTDLGSLEFKSAVTVYLNGSL